MTYDQRPRVSQSTLDQTRDLDAFNRLAAKPDALFAALGYRVTKVAKCCETGCEKCGNQGCVRVFDSAKGDGNQ